MGGKAPPEERDGQLMITMKQKERQKQKHMGETGGLQVKLKMRWGENSEFARSSEENALVPFSEKPIVWQDWQVVREAKGR